MATYNYNNEGSASPLNTSIKQGDTLVFNRTGSGANGTILNWTVPYTGLYRIETRGAKGGHNGGNGAIMRGDFDLSKGEVIKILVGHMGTSYITGSSAIGAGGGGGSFVAKSNNTPLIVAGGGGGTGHSGTGSSEADINGTTSQNGLMGAYSNAGAGGTNGNGGSFGSYSGLNSAGGGGFYGNGQGKSGDTEGGKSFVNGGAGGYTGGFGGGGGGRNGSYSCGAAPLGGSGGGGYSGGGGGGGTCNGRGGGGGSYNAGTNQNNTGSNSTHGLVTITAVRVVVEPTKPTTVNKPSTSRVGNTINVSWTAVPLPTQPSGVTLTSNTVYYEVGFFDGGKWLNVTSKTSNTNVNFTVPPMADTILAKLRVRAFVEAYGDKYFSVFTESGTFTVYNNNKPTIPNAFVSPVGSSRLRVGFSYTINWGASTDLDNDAITYKLQFYNGTAWSVVAEGIQGTSRTFIVPSGPDTLNAQFAVEAYDGRDYSDFRYSDKFEVFNNTPPNTPRPFTSPASDEMRIIDLQTPYTVSWGPADVEVGETAKYEVSFRGSALDNWVVIQDINHPNATKTTMQHILPNVQDSDTAQYRVRAYDGIEYGGYTESNQFSISGNKVTNTSGFNQELMDRMAINQEVRLSWQPANTTRNTEVLYDIEIFDGFTWNEVAYNVPTTSLVFRIPSMEDTLNAKIRIRSKTPFQYGGFVESAWTETKAFTIVNFFIFDTIAVPFLNDVQKKENADYLRQKVNDMRIVNDLPPLVYTDPVIIRYETAIKAVHFDEIEAGLLECFDKNPRAKFANVRTEQELRKVKEYSDQAELIQELPQRIDFICKALMNQ